MPFLQTPAGGQKKAGTPRKYLSPPPRALSAASKEISDITGEGEEEGEEEEEDEDLGRETELGTQTSERTTDEYETATTPGTEATTPVSELEDEDEDDEDRETDAETLKTEAEDTLDTDDEATTIKTGFEGTSVIEEDGEESTAKSPSAWSTKSDSQENTDLTTTGTGGKESGLPGTSGTTHTEVSTTTSTGDSVPTPPVVDKPQKGRKSKSPRKSTSPDKTGKKSSSPERKSVAKEGKTPQVRPPEGALKSREEQRPTTKEKGSRPGVTFKPGLVADSSQEDYLGPLVPLELVLPPGDDIMNIIFSKFITGTARTDGIEGYMETGLEQLSSALGRFLSNYNAKTTHKMDMVFFKQAIHHIVRLTRVLATTGGHALLIGTSNFTGRVSTAKLATFIVRAKFFHAMPARDRADNRSNLHKVLKEAFFVSGVQGREGVLLVGEEMGTECLQVSRKIPDVCSLMTEGTCPGLYDDEELMTIANQIMQGTVPGKHSDKFELALERYHKRIRTNLHVVVTMDLTGPVPLHHRLRQFPTLLLRSSCVDMYSRWTFEARRSDILWEMLGSTTSLTSVAHAMAYIHRSAQAALQRCFHDNHQLRRLFTPLTYMEFIDLFKSITAKLSREEKASIAKYEGCLSKVQEAQTTIAGQQAEVEELLPRLDEAREITQEWVYKVEEGRASYSKALQQCKEEEDRIEAMQGPVEKLRQAAQAEFDKVNPAYTAAVSALRSLSHSDLDEIKSYRVPPPGVVLVVNALCIIFGVELDWELGHQLISRGNFFEELEFYDKNNMPETVFQKLKIFVRDPHFDPRVIKGSSKAARSICMWVHAVFQYAAIHRDIKPKLEKLAEAEKEMNEAQAALGSKRVHAEEEKNNLESTIRSHTDSVRHSKSIEKQIKVLKDKKAKCQNVLTNMEAPISIWKVQLRKAQKRLSTAPGISILLEVLCLSYNIKEKQLKVLKDKKAKCQNVLINMEAPISIWKVQLRKAQKRLSTAPEKQIKVPKDKKAKCQNVLINMEAPIFIWKVQLRKAQKRLSTAPGDSLITAACVCYLGPFDSVTRQTLLLDWLHHCRTGEKIKSYKKQMMVPSSVTPSEDRGKNVLRNSRRSARREVILEEQVMWRQMGMPTNLTAIQNALVMRSCWQNRKRCWPLLVDPDGQAETWVRVLQETTTSWEGEHQAGESAKDGSRPSSTATQHTRDPSLPDSRDKTRPSSTLQMEDGTAGFGDSRSTTPLADRDTPSSQRTPDFQLDLSMYMDRPISPPEGGVEVVSADDPFLDSSLIRAFVTGYCILVTHVERTGITGPVLRKLMDRATLESNKAVKISDQDIPVHPGFCLYLSISSPLYLKGAGMADLPMYKTAVIDLSVSQAGVVKLLLKETLKLEKPEYEGQRRSLQADLIQSEKDLQEEKDNMMQKVLALQTPILEDATMLDALQSFQERTLEIDATIAETQSLQAQVGEKKRDYQPVASHGAILYEAVRRIAQIHPMYHYPLTNFIQMFVDSVKSRQRGKGVGNVGAIKARVIELNDCVTRVAYARLEKSMFSQHALLFALLIVIDKMKEAGEMTEEEWAVFANGIEGINDLQKDDKTSDSNGADNSLTKPDWLSFETWVQCALLESLPCFRGLRESLSRHSRHWREYFGCPPILLNPVTGPTLLNLTLIQKAILWRIVKPEQMLGICESLVLYKLGHVVRRPDARSLEEALITSEHHTPIVLLLPASADAPDSYNSCKGYASMDPFWEIKKLAKAHGMHGKVQQVMLGLPEEMDGAAAVVERGMAKGHWVVFNNCQMAEGWSQDVLELVKTIVTSASITVSLQEESDAADETDSQDGETVAESPKMNPNFRLWLVTTAEASTSIPGVALQHGVKLAYELPQDIPATVGTTYNSAVWAGQPPHGGQPRMSDQMKPLLTSLSLVHSLLLHRRKYGIAAFTLPHHWNQGSLSASVELLQGLVQGCQTDSPDGFSEGYETLVGDLVYGGRVSDLMDMDVVTSMVKQWAVGLGQSNTENGPIVSALLSNVKGAMHAGPQASQNKADLNSDPTLVGLDASAAQVFHLQKSRNTLDELEMITGVHGIRTPFMTQYDGTLALLEKLETYLQDVPEIQHTPQEGAAGRAEFVQEFFTTEVDHYKQLLQRVTSDVRTMQSALRGEIGLTAEMEQLLSSVVQHSVPRSWLVSSYPTATGLADWVQTLQARVEALQQYAGAEGGPVAVNLAAFTNPVGFLDAVLLQHCRQQFRDVQTFQYEVKVLEPSDLATSRPSSGVYLSGLHVHGALWDGKNGGLQPPARERVTCSLPKVWMKIVDTNLRKSSQVTVPSYNCPLYISAPRNDILGSDNVVMHLALPSAADVGVLVQRRVFVTSAL
uniref:Uncharacterized protein n=1 Tax=Branchiostoma floridae TaxID=7739 RepID=C3YSF3_BRAFL|eukprot:XP_002600642.1 hypothetical protein BRAFLDRAFT_102421 [Branchiostoma floridae]